MAKLTDEEKAANAIAKARQRELDKAKEQEKAQKALNGLLMHQRKLLEDISNATRTINQLVIDEKENSEEYAKSVAKRKELLDKYEVTQDKIGNLDRKQSNVGRVITGNLSDQTDYVEKMNSMLFAINDKTQKFLRTNETIGKTLNVQNDIVNKMNVVMRDTGDESGTAYTAYKMTNNILESVADLTLESADNLSKMGVRGYENVDVASTQLEIQKQLEVVEKHKGQLTDEQYGSMKAALGVASDQLNIVSEQEKKIDKARDLGNDVADSLGKGFERVGGIISALPGGDFLMKQFGFDKIASAAQEKIGGAMTDAFMSAGSAGGGMFSALGAGVKSFGMAMITGPQAIIFGTIALVGLMVKMFMDADAAVADLGKELGVSYGEAAKLYESSIDLSNSMNLVGINAEDVGKAIGEMAEEIPGFAQGLLRGNDYAKTMLRTATVLTSEFGLSAAEVGNLSEMSYLTGKSVDELANMAGKMGEKTIGAKDAMKALANVPKTITVAFKGTVDQLVKAAIKAKMLGTDLGKVQEIGDGMLDIESSLADEMEARVITGKNINLDKARELALNGDIAGLQDELLNQAGSLEDFTKMNRLGQQSMAKAMGMSVEEMTTMLAKATEMRDIGMDQASLDKLLNEGRDAAIKKAEELRKAGNEQGALAIEKLAHERESASVSEKFGDIMTKIQQTAMKLVTPLLEMVNSLFSAEEGAEGIGSTLSAVGSVLGTIGRIIGSVLGPAFDLLTTPISFLFKMIGGIGKLLSGDVSGALKDVGGAIFDFLLAPFKAIPDLVLGIIDSIFGTDLKGGFDSMFEPLKEVFVSLYEAGSSLFEGIWEVAGPLITQIKAAFSGIGDAIGSIFGGDNEKKSTGFLDALKVGVSVFGKILGGIGKMIGVMIINPIQFVVDLVGGIIKLFTGDFEGGLKQIGGGILSYLMMPFKLIGSLIESVFGADGLGAVKDVLGDIGEIILNYLMTPFNTIYDIVSGIVSIFTGDFMGGISMIGDAIGNLVMKPLETVKNIGSSIWNAITGGDDEEETDKQVKASASMTTTGDKVESSQVQAVPAMATGGTTTKSGLAIVGEQGPEIVSLPQSATVANASVTQQAQSAVGATAGGGEGGNAKMETLLASANQLLQQILSETSKDAVIKVGDKVITEVGSKLRMKKNAVIGLDNQYGASVKG